MSTLILSIAYDKLTTKNNTKLKNNYFSYLKNLKI